MINVQATVDGNEFITTCRGLDAETMEQIAAAFPAVFSGCFVYGAGVASPPAKRLPVYDGNAPKPRERKPREAKEPTEAEQKADRAVLAYVAEHNGCRSAEIAIDGLDKDAKNGALKRLVAADVLRLEGKAGGARYYIVERAGA